MAGKYTPRAGTASTNDLQAMTDERQILDACHNILCNPKATDSEKRYVIRRMDEVIGGECHTLADYNRAVTEYIAEAKVDGTYNLKADFAQQ